MSNNELLKSDRKIIFITGSNYSGKSLLGHIFALNEEFLYNYTSISPQKYFNTNGNLKEAKKKSFLSLKKDIDQLCYYLGGGFHKYENERWLRNDYLAGYDYVNFNNKLKNNLHDNINLPDFYLLWDHFLQQCRVEGQNTLITIFEVENFLGNFGI